MLLKSLGLGELPKNSLLLVEEDLGGTKSVFLQRLVLDSLKKGQKALYISTRYSAEEILEEIGIGLRAGEEMQELTVHGDLGSRESLVEICKSLSAQGDARHVNICVVDTFSSLFMEENLHCLINDLKLLLKTSRNCNITFYLASDMGVLQGREEHILRSMVDGIIQFRTEYPAGKINRFINIPKMRGVPPIERLIPYKIKEGTISPDTRERVG
ncbi:RAD55 family ATPase [Methanosarcina sp. T3]|uniref:RAD55 family ATPase n=1 Tax=Methanosarcina sp. T3 TaxID=3439062 RepID=UPI003F8261CB